MSTGDDGPIVQTLQGKLQGIVGEDAGGNKYYGFRGIPYAQPPIGPLKFKPPQKPLPWEGIREASIEGEPCFQRDAFTKQFIGSEDCLYLNVYTPNLKPNDGTGDVKLKPVMFWIPGGSYVGGSGSNILYGPEFLLTEDVVVVTINFRLGILGLLALDDPNLGIPGNATFKDIVMALKWVNQNIETFCGNPNNVTVFGESAGGACAHFLMLSSMSKGLFHRVIAQSGCAINTWSVGYNFAKEFMTTTLGHPKNLTDAQIYEILKNMPLEDLFMAQRKYQTSEVFLPNIKRAFGPIVENFNSEEEAFFTDTPLNILKSGRYNHVPLMMGCTNGEGMFLEMCLRDDANVSVLDSLNLFVPYDLPTDKFSTEQLADKIKKRYLVPNKTRLECLFDVLTDGNFFRTMYNAAQLHLSTSEEPIYLYKATVETNLNILKKMLRLKCEGLCHGDDINYIFKSVFTPAIKPGSIEDVSQHRFTKLWANFARNGVPNSPAQERRKQEQQLIPVTWKPITKNCVHVLEIGSELILHENPDREVVAFWNNLATFESKL